jgi:hypothetical protein
MLRAKIIVVAAMALLFAQLQCSATCTTQAGNGPSVPPCHRHYHPQAPCHEDVGITAASPQVAPVAVMVDRVAVAAETLGSDFIGHRPADSSPPGFARLSFLVLRI